MKYSNYILRVLLAIGLLLTSMSACTTMHDREKDIQEIVLKKTLSKSDINALTQNKQRCIAEHPMLYLSNSAKADRDSPYTTGLLVASANGLEEFVQWHINNGSDVRAKSYKGLTALHVACTAKIATMLIDAGADVNIRAEKGKTPLISMAASVFERTKTAEILLRRGAKIDDVDDKGWTALMHSVKERYSTVWVNSIQRLLLEKGANFKKKNNDGQSVFELSVLYGDDDQLETLYKFPGVKDNLSKNDYDQVLLKSVKMHDMDKKIRFLISEGADVNAMDENGMSVLHHAYQTNNTVVLLYLKDKGAIYDKKSNCKVTIPHILVRDNNYWNSQSDTNKNYKLRYLALTEKYLKKNRDDLNQPGCDNPLSIASRRRLPDFAKLFLKYGAKVNFKNRHGYSPLHRSFWTHEEPWLRYNSEYLRFTLQTVKELIDGGAEVNLRANNGNTPLLQYAQFLYAGRYINYLKRNKKSSLEDIILNILSVLIDSGADVNISNRQKQTALILISKAGSAKLAKVLLDAGADFSLRDKKGKTALDYAKESKNTPLVRLLENRM